MIQVCEFVCFYTEKKAEAFTLLSLIVDPDATQYIATIPWRPHTILQIYATKYATQALMHK